MGAVPNPPSDGQRWHLVYHLTAAPEGLARDEAIARSRPDGGACDAAILISIVLPQDGSYSQKVLHLDGRTGKPLDDGDLFKAWCLLAAQLADSTALGEGRRELCRLVWDATVKAMRGAREEKAND